MEQEQHIKAFKGGTRIKHAGRDLYRVSIDLQLETVLALKEIAARNGTNLPIETRKGIRKYLMAHESRTKWLNAAIDSIVSGHPITDANQRLLHDGFSLIFDL